MEWDYSCCMGLTGSLDLLCSAFAADRLDISSFIAVGYKYGKCFSSNDITKGLIGIFLKAMQRHGTKRPNLKNTDDYADEV